MGQLDPGLVATLLFLIPGLWNSFSIMAMPNLFAHFLEYFPSCVYSFGCDVGVPWLLYWLFLLTFLVTKFYDSKALSRKKRTGSRHQKIQRFTRRKLAFFMLLKCRDHLFSFPSITFADGFQLQADQLGFSWRYTPLDQQHCCWRRAQAKSKHRVWRCRVVEHEGFLNPKGSSACWWNQYPVANTKFLAEPNMDSFLPHADFGVVPEEVLTKFVEDRADTFLAATRLMLKLKSADRATAAEKIMQRANIFSNTYQTKDVKGKKWRHTFKTCPLVWDTGASAGLAPFRCDFIDYMKSQMPVNNIARTNMVIGIGTALHKFWINGGPIYLPCLSFHLPSDEAYLFSFQTYHKLYGGHSSIFGDCVVKMFDNMPIEVDIDPAGRKCAHDP